MSYSNKPNHEQTLYIYTSMIYVSLVFLLTSHAHVYVLTNPKIRLLSVYIIRGTQCRTRSYKKYNKKKKTLRVQVLI